MSTPIPAPADTQAAFADALAVLLREPLQSSGAVLLAQHAAGEPVEWVDAVDDTVLPSAPCGWLFRLEDHAIAGPALYLHTVHQDAAGNPRVQLSALLARHAWRLHRADADATPFSTEVAASIHALRNGLNASVMNAALLAAYAEQCPESLRDAVMRLESATTRSAQELHRLVALLDATR